MEESMRRRLMKMKKAELVKRLGYLYTRYQGDPISLEPWLEARI